MKDRSSWPGCEKTEKYYSLSKWNVQLDCMADGTRTSEADAGVALGAGVNPGENESSVWEFHAVIPDGELNGGNPNDPNAYTSFDLGTLVFNENGQLSRSITNDINIPWNGAGAGTISIGFGRSPDPPNA